MMALSLFIGLLTYISLCLRPIKSNRLLTFFGKYSFEIYLIHGAVNSVLFGMAYT
jgi:peptidoglycan/LPS O-acetylase OafA/YrhL